MDKPCISDNLEILTQNNNSIIIFNKDTKKTFSVGIKEYSVLSSLDGSRTLEEINAMCDDFSVEDMQRLINEFRKIGLVECEGKKESFILKNREGMSNPNKVANPNNILIRILYCTILYFSVPIFIIGVLVTFTDRMIIRNLLADSLKSPRILMLIPIVLLVVLVHRLAHVIVAKYYGGQALRFGRVPYCFIPSACSDIIDTTLIKSKLKRILIFLAGTMSNMLLAGIAFIFLKVITGQLYEVLLWFALVNSIFSFANLLIFLKLDVYFILQELLEEKDLRKNSILYFKLCCTKILRKSDKDDFQRREEVEHSYNPSQRTVYGVFVFLSIVYLPLLVFNFFSCIFYFITS